MKRLDLQANLERYRKPARLQDWTLEDAARDIPALLDYCEELERRVEELEAHIGKLGARLDGAEKRWIAPDGNILTTTKDVAKKLYGEHVYVFPVLIVRAEEEEE